MTPSGREDSDAFSICIGYPVLITGQGFEVLFLKADEHEEAPQAEELVNEKGPLELKNTAHDRQAEEQASSGDV